MTDWNYECRGAFWRATYLMLALAGISGAAYDSELYEIAIAAAALGGACFQEAWLSWYWERKFEQRRGP